MCRDSVPDVYEEYHRLAAKLDDDIPAFDEGTLAMPGGGVWPARTGNRWVNRAKQVSLEIPLVPGSPAGREP